MRSTSIILVFEMQCHFIPNRLTNLDIKPTFILRARRFGSKAKSVPTGAWDLDLPSVGAVDQLQSSRRHRELLNTHLRMQFWPPLCKRFEAQIEIIHVRVCECPNHHRLKLILIHLQIVKVIRIVPKRIIQFNRNNL